MGTWIAALALFAGQLAPASPAAPLAPTGKWTVEYEPASCVVSRGFGEAANPVLLSIRQAPTGDGGSLVLIVNDKPRAADRGNGSVQIGQQGDISPTAYTSVTDPKIGRRVTLIPISPTDFAALPQATAITIVADGSKVTLAPKATDKALSALQTCNDQLLQTWGVDPQENALLATRAKIVTGSIEALGDQYPAEAIRARAQGKATLVIAVDKTGKVSSCRIVSTSGYEALDKASCAGAVRVRFMPAIAKDGNPMPSHYVMPYNWVLPN
jgi:TonB family protein